MAQLPSRLTAPPQALVELAALIRARLHSTVRATVRTGVSGVVRLGRPAPARRAEGTPDADTVVVAAAAQFAPSAYARARLLRQLHACGLLTDTETAHAERMIGVAN